MATIKGGDKFAKVLAEIAKQLGEPGKVRVGLLEGSTAPNGDSLPLRAALNEFGHGTTPPRPAVRNMIAEKSPEWADAVAANLKATNYNVPLTLERIGEGIKGQWQQAYLDLWSPPLAESTIKRKGFAKPLIDKSDMLNAVDYEVVDS